MIIRQDKQSIRREGQKCAMRNLEEEEKKKYLPVEGQEGDFKEEIASLRKERNGMFSIICLQLHASRVRVGREFMVK